LVDAEFGPLRHTGRVETLGKTADVVEIGISRRPHDHKVSIGVHRDCREGDDSGRMYGRVDGKHRADGCSRTVEPPSKDDVRRGSRAVSEPPDHKVSVRIHRNCGRLISAREYLEARWTDSKRIAVRCAIATKAAAPDTVFRLHQHTGKAGPNHCVVAIDICRNTWLQRWEIEEATRGE